ncbi:DUF551 domain-containing protein [Citrobacter freundii]|nr:DUF551 domain-containing protein [Citrobacter freundii]
MTTNNHPAHGPVSLKRLHQISEILSKAAAQSDGGNLGYAMADAVKVIDGEIAAFGAEPVADVVAWSSPNEERTCDIRLRRHDIAPGPLYTAPPAPVSVPDLLEQFAEFMAAESIKSGDYPDGWQSKASNAAHEYAQNIRAAMLQAEPVSNHDELPLDYLQGHKDGLEWAAQLAESNHPQTGDWLYDDPIELAMAIRKGPDMPTAQAGNSPVTPDGWVACVERMPSAGEQVLAYRPDAPESNDPLIKMATYVGGSAHGHGFDCYCKPTHWMPLPAAPQQEVRLALEIGMSRYAGAMQKLVESGD